MPRSLSEIDYSECINGKMIFTTVDGKHFIESNSKCNKSIRRYGQIKQCICCKNQFFARNDSIKNGNGCFCSNECSSKYNSNQHIIDYDTLKNLYENSDLTREEIEQKFGISNTTLTRLVNKYNLKHRQIERAPPQILTCSNCGCEFERANYLVEMFKGKFKNTFCSFDCKGEHQRKTRDNKKRVTVTCSWCGNPHEKIISKVTNNNYCCKECQYKHISYLKRDRVETSCYTCGEPLSLKRCQISERNFCSRECMGKQLSIEQRGENCHLWRGGISFKPYSPEFNNRLKTIIRERDRFTCQLCGITEELVGQKLDVHHIDYDKTNNEVINLISLCKSCHSKTNFKRDDWINLFNSKNEVITFQE